MIAQQVLNYKPSPEKSPKSGSPRLKLYKGRSWIFRIFSQAMNRNYHNLNIIIRPCLTWEMTAELCLHFTQDGEWCQMPTFPAGLEDNRSFPSGSVVMSSAIHLQCWRQKTQVLSLGRKDSLEKRMATHSGFLPEESHWKASLVGYSHKESDTERLSTHTRRTLQFSCSVMSDSVTWWTAACQASLSITNSQSLLKLMSIEWVMPSNRLILCRPLLLLPSIFPSSRVFSNESVLRIITWPKCWSFSFSIIPSNEYSGLISFRMDWLDLLVVQGTLKSFLQDHSSKASILQLSALFIVQLSHRIRVNIMEWNSVWSHIYVLLEFSYRCLCGVMYLDSL